MNISRAQCDCPVCQDAPIPKVSSGVCAFCLYEKGLKPIKEVDSGIHTGCRLCGHGAYQHYLIESDE